MPSQQERCEKGLREWRRAFLGIRQPASKVMAVNRLCSFAQEMRAYWPDTTLPGNGCKPPVQAEPYQAPVPLPLDAVMREIVTPVNFAGVVEGEPAPVQHPVTTLDPDVVEIAVHAYCPNPRLLSGMLDGKPVSVWKGPRNWRLPCKILARKDASSPNYLPV